MEILPTGLPDLSKPSKTSLNLRKTQILEPKFSKKHQFLNILGFWKFLEVLEGLKSSGRPVGRISTNFRPNPSSWCRVMTVVFLYSWLFLVSLEGLKSSGRPVGRISTYFRQKRSGGFRAMTKKPKKLTSKKVTSASMCA